MLVVLPNARCELINVRAHDVLPVRSYQDCIQYLKEQRLQTMTFIPLSTIRVKPVDERLRQLGGSAKLVLDVIQYDETIERAMLYALGCVLICERELKNKM